MMYLDYTLAVIGIDEAIFITIIMAAVSYAASLLLAPDPPTLDPLEDASKNMAGVRGTLAPLLLGRNKITPIIAYVGNRVSWQKVVGSVPDPDGFWEEDDDVYSERFRETGMHILCIGPAKQLHQILSAGKLIFDRKLDSVTNPSGTEIFTCTDEDGSRFRIYWGEQDQPIDTELASLTGVSSRYPYCCYIFWIEKQLGANARWPNVEYVVSCATKGEESSYISYVPPVAVFSVTRVYTPFPTHLTWYQKNPFLYTTNPAAENIKDGDRVVFPDGTEQIAYASFPHASGWGFRLKNMQYIFNLTASPYTVTLQEYGTFKEGINPALGLRQLLFYGFPHGLSLSTLLFDMASLNDMIPYFATGGTEPAPATLYLKDGKSYQDGIAAILSDYGISMYPDAVTGRLTFKIIRTGETPVLIPDSMIDLDKVEDTKAYSVLAPEKIVYTYTEAVRNFSRSTILIDNDGKATLSDNPNMKRESLNTPTDIDTASAIASRKEQEVRVDRAVKMPVSVDMEYLNIGSVVYFESLSGLWRLVTKDVGIDSASVEMGFALDAYSVDNSYVLGTSSGSSLMWPVVPDLYVFVFEGNRYLNPDQNGYYIIRARAHVQIQGAWLYRSETDVTDDFRGSSSSLSYQTAGVLAESMEATGGVVESLEVYDYGEDFDAFWNIVVSDQNWRAGQVLAVVGTELMSVQSATRIDESTVQLNNILRGRFGTVVASHASGEDMGLFYKASLPFISDTVVSVGNVLYFRTRPYTSQQLMDLDNIDSVVLAYGGGGFRPLSCENLNTDTDVPAWKAGADIVLRWDYRNTTAQAGAGISLTGEATFVPEPEGYFILEILTTGGVLKRTETLTEATYAYSNASLVSDFSSEPSGFKARVYNILNGLTSEVEETTFTKV